MNRTHRLRRFIGNIWQDIVSGRMTPKPVIIISIALVLIAIGLPAILIPFIPAFLFLTPGILLLSLYSPTVYRFLKQKAGKYPRLESAADRLRNWLIRLIKPRQ